jgi:hypothetical protein
VERVNDLVWDAGDCAAFFKVCRKHFLRDLRFREGFPKQLHWSLEGRPRWSSDEVKAWALRQDYASAA